MSPNGDFAYLVNHDRRSMSARTCDWKAVSARKTRDRQALLDRWPEWRLKEEVPDSTTDVSDLPTSQLSGREYEIVHLDATSLVERIRDRRYTSTEVLKAFCHVALIAQGLTNCLTEIMFEEGLQRAAELDRHLEEKGQVVGPLHGLPVSIKDHIRVKGHDTATGYIAWAYHKVAQEDALAVSTLRKAGAVLYVKTANPQTLLVSVKTVMGHPQTLTALRSPSKPTTTSTVGPAIHIIEVCPQYVPSARMPDVHSASYSTHSGR